MPVFEQSPVGSAIWEGYGQMHCEREIDLTGTRDAGEQRQHGLPVYQGHRQHSLPGYQGRWWTETAQFPRVPGTLVDRDSPVSPCIGTLVDITWSDFAHGDRNVHNAYDFRPTIPLLGIHPKDVIM